MSLNIKSYILIILDYLSAVFAWILFFYFRKTQIEFSTFYLDKQFYLGVIIVPIFWLFLYSLQGTYLQIKRLYRIQIVNLTIFGATLGSLFLFFLLLLDDIIPSHHSYYKSLIALFTLHFCITIIPRYLYVSRQVKKIQNGGSNLTLASIAHISRTKNATGFLTSSNRLCKKNGEI